MNDILKLADSLEKSAEEIRRQHYQEEGEKALAKALEPGGIFHDKWGKKWKWYVGVRTLGKADAPFVLSGFPPGEGWKELEKIGRMHVPDERLTLALDADVCLEGSGIGLHLVLPNATDYTCFADYHEIKIERVNRTWPANDYRGTFHLVCDKLDDLDAKRRHLGAIWTMMKNQLEREKENVPF